MCDLPPPTISILLPAFNARDSVGEAIESVLAQTYDDWELLVIDDGSTDDSASVIAQFVARDPRIRLISRPNGGEGAARNSGIEVARGRYCAFIDADDLWLPTKLERQVPCLSDNAVTFTDAWVEQGGTCIPYGTRIGRPAGDYPTGEVFSDLLRQNFIPGINSIVVPFPLLRAVGGFDESLERAPDWDLWLRLALAGARFEYVPEPLTLYRIVEGSLSSDVEALRRAAIQIVSRMRTQVPTERRAEVNRRLHNARRELEIFLRKRAWLAAIAGDSRNARADLLASFRCNPRSWRALVGAVLAILPFAPKWVARRLPTPQLLGSFIDP